MAIKRKSIGRGVIPSVAVPRPDETRLSDSQVEAIRQQDAGKEFSTAYASEKNTEDKPVQKEKTASERAITVKIPVEMYKALKLKLAENDETISLVIRNAIQDYIGK